MSVDKDSSILQKALTKMGLKREIRLPIIVVYGVFGGLVSAVFMDGGGLGDSFPAVFNRAHFTKG